jgi:hypothetical protein
LLRQLQLGGEGRNAFALFFEGLDGLFLRFLGRFDCLLVYADLGHILFDLLPQGLLISFELLSPIPFFCHSSFRLFRSFLLLPSLLLPLNQQLIPFLLALLVKLQHPSHFGG